MRPRAAALVALAALLVAAPAAGDPAQDPNIAARPTSGVPPLVGFFGSGNPAGLGGTRLDPVDLSKPLQLLSDSVVQTDGGSTLHLPPGRFYREDVWQKLDTEIHRLQDAETRLAAQNTSLRASLSATAGWQPGWWTLLTVVAAGGAAGWYLRGKL